MTDRRRLFIACALAAFGAAAGVTISAADQQASKAERPLFKLDVVMMRYQGEKKLSSVPYSMLIGGGFTRLRVGVDVPGDPLTTTSKEGVVTTRRDSRFVGTSIDGAINQGESGRHEVHLSIQDAAILPDPKSKEFARDFGVVAFRTFSISNTLPIREGQPVTFVVGTDQVTGETLRAEVTVTLVK